MSNSFLSVLDEPVDFRSLGEATSAALADLLSLAVTDLPPVRVLASHRGAPLSEPDLDRTDGEAVLAWGDAEDSCVVRFGHGVVSAGLPGWTRRSHLLLLAAAIGAARLTGNPIEFGDGLVRDFSSSAGIGEYAPEDLVRRLRRIPSPRSLDEAVRDVLDETVFAADPWYGEDVPFDDGE